MDSLIEGVLAILAILAIVWHIPAPDRLRAGEHDDRCRCDECEEEAK